jgi:hypothetical protein
MVLYRSEGAMFEVDRIYPVKSEKSGLTEWYFLIREGRRGPYSSVTNARIALNLYVSDCIKNGITNRQASKRYVNRLTPADGINVLYKPDGQN